MLIQSTNDGTEIRYYYDNLGQLIREENEQLGKIFVYTYDKAGNITSKTTYIIPEEEGASAELESVVNYGYSMGAWGDQLTEYNGNAISYDGIGNPLTYHNGAQFTWLGRKNRSRDRGVTLFSCSCCY